MIYVFDVDGTLTPSRQEMQPHFRETFERFAKQHSVYLVTGSDRQKTMQQISPHTYYLCDGVFQCAGNQLYHQDLLVYENNWDPPDSLVDQLNDILEKSKAPVKTGIHLERRTGMINFSTVGRLANQQQREEYKAFDQRAKERRSIVAQIETHEIEAAIGGETGIDIYPRGKNKSQILEFLQPPVTFFGDDCNPGGNDYPLKQRITKTLKGTTHSVQSPEETLKLILQLLK